MLSKTDEEELELLRRHAAKFIQDPLELAFFELQRLVDKPQSNRLDAIMPSNAFYILARAVLELKRSLK